MQCTWNDSEGSVAMRAVLNNQAAAIFSNIFICLICVQLQKKNVNLEMFWLWWWWKTPTDCVESTNTVHAGWGRFNGCQTKQNMYEQKKTATVSGIKQIVRVLLRSSWQTDKRLPKVAHDPQVSSYSSYPHFHPLTCHSHILRHLFGELDQFHGSRQSSQRGCEFERLW